MGVSRGEIWWVEEETRGRRPGLVLTRAEAVPVLRKLLVVPATRTVRGIPTEVPLDETDGMPRPCALSLDNVRVVPAAYLTERIARLSAERMRQVCTALRHATGC